MMEKVILVFKEQLVTGTAAIACGASAGSRQQMSGGYYQDNQAYVNTVNFSFIDSPATTDGLNLPVHIIQHSLTIQVKQKLIVSIDQVEILILLRC